jgi:hypothetical protein
VQNAIDERKLAGLTPARRNRYYYGKLMDVLHFSMEQQYVLAKEWLFNRAVVGPGVVCGLDVKPVSGPQGNGIVITAGLAFDGWGREIVVPDDIQLVPLTITDRCGTPQPSSNDPLPSELVVKICYDECRTDFAPALVGDPDCGCGGDCEAGTIVETYCLNVLPGTAPPVTEPCLDGMLKALQGGDLHTVLCELSQTCAATPDDPCLTLANVKVADGTLTVDSCGPRRIAPTNRILMQLISCLVECCSGHEPPPPPPPPPKKLLHVTGVRVLSRGNLQPNDPSLPVVGELAPPNHVITVKREPLPEVIDITFNAVPPAFDPSSVVVGDSLVVTAPANRFKVIPGMPGNVLRIQRLKGFQAGKYHFELIGDPGAGGTSPRAILAQGGTRLDGDFPAAGGAGWHSGDGAEGGNFSFELEVVQ